MSWWLDIPLRCEGGHTYHRERAAPHPFICPRCGARARRRHSVASKISEFPKFSPALGRWVSSKSEMQGVIDREADKLSAIHRRDLKGEIIEDMDGIVKPEEKDILFKEYKPEGGVVRTHKDWVAEGKEPPDGYGRREDQRQTSSSNT